MSDTPLTDAIFDAQAWRQPDTWATQIDVLEAHARTLERENARLREALEKIAAFNDVAGSQQLADTGSYTAFDEPGSVEIARASLNGE